MKKSLILILILALTVGMAFTGCSKDEAGSGDTAGAYPQGNLDFIAPGGAGGGWDLTIRTTAKVLADTGLVSNPMPITNKPGAGGGVTLAHLQTISGEDKTLVVYSPPLILINLNGSTEFSYKDTTPIARLIADYGAFVVPKDSKFKSINEVMEAIK
jgi:putative tricarboxylic transport membrane protein